MIPGTVMTLRTVEEIKTHIAAVEAYSKADFYNKFRRARARELDSLARELENAIDRDADFAMYRAAKVAADEAAAAKAAADEAAAAADEAATAGMSEFEKIRYYMNRFGYPG